MVKRTPKLVPVRKIDFLKAVKDNYGRKSQEYLTHLISALCIIADSQGTGEGINRIIEDTNPNDKIWLRVEDIQ